MSCVSATISVVDSILARVGASDSLISPCVSVNPIQVSFKI